VFFSVAAYKRRSYLLPLWPAAAVMLAWMVKAAAARMRSRAAPWIYGTLCAGLIVFNFVFIPNKEVRDCGGDSFRPAAEEIKRVVGPSEPLYLYGFWEEVAPLLFYLDRNAPELGGKLGDAPPGYIIVPAGVWAKKRGEALDLAPVLESSHGHRRLILLRRGKLYARQIAARAAHAGNRPGGDRGQRPRGFSPRLAVVVSASLRIFEPST
jgi:hypothetical protein